MDTGDRGQYAIVVHILLLSLFFFLVSSVVFNIAGPKGAEGSWEGGGNRGEIAPSRRPTYKTTGFSKKDNNKSISVLVQDAPKKTPSFPCVVPTTRSIHVHRWPDKGIGISNKVTMGRWKMGGVLTKPQPTGNPRPSHCSRARSKQRDRLKLM